MKYIQKIGLPSLLICNGMMTICAFLFVSSVN